MFRIIVPGAAVAALLAGAAQAAPAPPPLAWIITPGEGACRTVLDLATRSGAVTPVSLTSDGVAVSLRFQREDLPERAFLPIRVDQKRFSNLMLRGAELRTGELILSEETETAMRRGSAIAVAWLGEEPLSGSLSGSGPGIADLKTCGAQAASQARARTSADAAAKAEAEANGRARAVADAQVAAARAQTAAAEAERQRVAETSERQRRAEAIEQERLYAEQRQREYSGQRQRDYEAAEARAAYDAAQRERAYREYRDPYEPRWIPPQPVYPTYRRY